MSKFEVLYPLVFDLGSILFILKMADIASNHKTAKYLNSCSVLMSSICVQLQILYLKTA
jgi:hypothetical protein